MPESNNQANPKPSRYALMMRLLKQLWMILVLLALIFFVSNNFENILEQLNQIEFPKLVLSLLLIAIGRVLMMLMAYDSLISLGEDLSRKTVFIIVSISDPAKYLPGGIWHFVGRAGYYQAEGITLKTGSQALLRENLWLVVSAGFSGSIFLILANTHVNVWWLCSVFILIWWIVLKLWSPSLNYVTITLQVMTQFVMWVALAFSFVLIFPSFSTNFDANMLIIGAFIISWLVGFVSLFAPSGLGIREAVLVSLLLPVLSANDSAIFALIHRILWIGVELIFTLIAWIFFNMNSREH